MNNIFLNILSSNFIVEYIYENESINTDLSPFLYMQNGNNNEYLLFNGDDSENITGNTRNRSFLKTDVLNNKFYSLTPFKLGPAYNDIDSKVTNSVDLPLNFTVTENVKYDKIRIHFIQGFSFNDTFNGIYLNVSVNSYDNKVINLLNSVYKKGDRYVINNSSPFLYSGRQYSTYIEYKVPSVSYMIDKYLTDFVNNPLNLSDNLVCKITNNKGLETNALVNIKLGTVDKFTTIDNQIYTNLKQIESTSINNTDNFDDVGVYINESTKNDYIEFYGTFNSSIFGDYIDKLNNSNIGKHIIINKLSVFEQIPNTNSSTDFIGNYNVLNNTPNIFNQTFYDNYPNGSYWISTESGVLQNSQIVSKGDLIIKNDLSVNGFDIIESSDLDNYLDISTITKTSDIEFIQNNNFNEINKFRPILKFSGLAISFRVDYIMQIFNVDTDTITEKRGSYISFNASKYGNKLLTINPGIINVTNVFNKKVINEIANKQISSNTNLIQNTDLYNKNIISFKQSNNIYAGSNNVNIDENGNIVLKGSLNTKSSIKGQGETIIYLSPFDNFVQFDIYEETNNVFNSIDLSKLGDVYINFVNKDGEIVKIKSSTNSNISSTKGQVIFKVPSNVYNSIIGNTDKVFYLTIKSGKNGSETVLYNGKYLDISQKQSNLNIQEQLEQTKIELENLQNNFNETVDERVKYLINERDKQIKTDKDLQNKAVKLKSSTFNPFGATGGFGLTGPIGSTNRN